ncbi:hypothetical protein CALVIDRAFT_417065 [Calocera viscosa TUFC12733]|uniref:Uncharacterized protein n=1 Tax=Calocera viscosa (strain TUFC12733) TaxID=1330018 RepID=A0A167PFU7_CALVF|nr:hypothetical protein CALVIDRAFT_417065 [Calocera viscosa TUFC12733]
MLWVSGCAPALGKADGLREVSQLFWDAWREEAGRSDVPWMADEGLWNVDLYRVEPSPSQLKEEGKWMKRRAGRPDQNFRWTYRSERGVCSLGQGAQEEVCALRNCGVCRLLESGMRDWGCGTRFALGRWVVRFWRGGILMSNRQPSIPTWETPFAADTVARQSGVNAPTRCAIVCKTKPAATWRTKYGHAVSSS